MVDQQRINQDKVDVWVCREEEQLGCVRGQRSILHQPKRKMRQDDLVSFFFSVGVIDNEEVIVNVKNERW